MMWNPYSVAVCVALPVLVSILLALLLFNKSADPYTAPTAAPYTARTAAPDTARTAAPYIAPTAAPYTAGRVVMQPVDSESSSLTGSLCGHHSCFAYLDDRVSDVLVTSDRQVVLAMEKQQSIVVQSSSGEQRVTLGCLPGGVTELPSRRIAVTCSKTPAVLLISLESSDHQIQRIPTGKSYWSVATHPVDQTLIVGTWIGSRIDVITLQGEVVRTLVDTHQLSVNFIFPLTVANGYLLVTGYGSNQIHRIHLSDTSQPSVEILAGSFPSWPTDTAVDKAGNVFIVLQDGAVLVRNTEGHHRQLLAGRDDGRKYVWCRITLHDNRLLVVTVTRAKGHYKSVVTEYQLVDQ